MTKINLTISIFFAVLVPLGLVESAHEAATITQEILFIINQCEAVILKLVALIGLILICIRAVLEEVKKFLRDLADSKRKQQNEGDK